MSSQLLPVTLECQTLKNQDLKSHLSAPGGSSKMKTVPSTSPLRIWVLEKDWVRNYLDELVE